MEDYDNDQNDINKVLRKLKEDKVYWENKENDSCTYVAAADEEPVIPEYDYETVAGKIEAIDAQVVKIKHALSVTNAANKVSVNGAEMTIDEILVKMSQLNRRKSILDFMRKQEPKRRISSGVYSSRKTAPEYKYINYDLELIKSEYERIDSEISEMQLVLDKYNQTFEFEVDIDLQRGFLGQATVMSAFRENSCGIQMYNRMRYQGLIYSRVW